MIDNACFYKKNTAMKNAILSGLYQALTLKFIVAVLGTVISIFLGSLDSLIRCLQQQGLLPAGFVYSFFYNALSSDSVLSFLPIVSVLPFAGTYVEDQKNKFCRFFLIRCSHIDYSFSRIFVAFLCGCGVVILGTFIAWGGAILFFLPKQFAQEMSLSPIVQIMEKQLLLSLGGGLWSVLGMTVSTIMESKYTAYATPFITYFLLVMLCERYFPNVFLLYPPNWMAPELWPYGVWGAAIFLLELTLSDGILFIFRSERKLQEL